MYSSIEEASRKDVILKCYWPLFKLADMGIPIGIESPAITLEIINELDPDWILSLSKYIAEVDTQTYKNFEKMDEEKNLSNQLAIISELIEDRSLLHKFFN